MKKKVFPNLYFIGLEQQGYGYLIKDLKKCLDGKKKNSDEKEDFITDNFKLSPQYLLII